MTWDDALKLSGVVGMVTGIVGACLGYLGYRRAGQMKALDLRLELRTTCDDAHRTADGLFDLINKADASRVAVLTPTVGAMSGARQLWAQECAADRVRVEALRAQLPDAGADFKNLDPDALESKLVEIGALKAQIDSLHGKYAGALAADDRSREQIRAENQAVARERMTGQRHE